MGRNVTPANSRGYCIIETKRLLKTNKIVKAAIDMRLVYSAPKCGNSGFTISYIRARKHIVAILDYFHLNLDVFVTT